MNRLARLFFIFLLTLSGTAFGQTQQYLDSIIHRLTIIPSDTNKVILLNRIGGSVKDSAQMFFYTNASIELSKKLGYVKGDARANEVRGNYYLIKELNYSKGNFYYTEAHRLHKSIGNNPGISRAYRIFARINSIFKNYSKALEHLHQSEHYDLESKDIQALNADYQTIAEIYLNVPDFDSAYFYLNKSNELGYHTDASAAVYFMNLVSVYIGKMQLDSAELYIHKTDSVYLLLKNPFGIIWNKMNTGQVELLRGNYKNAIINLKVAYDSAEIWRSGDMLTNVFPIIIEAYEKNGDFKNGFALQKEWFKLKDSLMANEISNSITSQQLNYQQQEKDKLAFLEKEKQDAIDENEKRKQSVLLWSVVFGLGVVIVFAAFVLRSNNQKKKANLIILLQKEEVEHQKSLIEEKQKEILDSIQYAKFIQNSLMPTEKYIEKKLNDLKKE